MRAMTRKASLLFVIVCLAVIFLWYLLRNLEFTKPWAFGDLVAFPHDLETTTKLTFFVWNQEGMGFVSLKPFNYYLTSLSASALLGSNIAQKVLLLSAMLLAFWSSLFLLKRLGLKAVPAVLGSLVYAFNPITISEIIGGSITLIIYAVFPVVFWLIFKILCFEDCNKKDLLILGLASFAVFNLHAAFWYILLLTPLFIVALTYRTTKPKRFVRFLVPLAVAALVLAPNIVGYIGIYGASAGKINVIPDTLYCYSDATIFNVIRLAGNRGSAQAAEYLDYNSINLFTTFGYSLILVGSFAFFLKVKPDKTQLRRTMIHTLLLALVVLVGAVLLIRNFPGILDLNSILSSLRNPGKLMYPLAFVMTLIFSFGLDALLTRLSKYKKRLIPLVVPFLVASVFIYNYPALNGDLGLEETRGQDYYIEDKYASLPSILNSLDPSYSHYRVLFLPWEYSTLLKVESEVPNYFGMPLGGGVTANTNWLKETLTLAIAKDSSDRSSLLGLFSVKYIVIDQTFDNQNYAEDNNVMPFSGVYESYDSYWVAGSPSYFYSLFDNDSNFSLKFQNSDFIIFENKNAANLIYSRASDIQLELTDIYSDNLLADSVEKGYQAWPKGLTNIISPNTICLAGQEKWWTYLCLDVPVEAGKRYSLGFSVKAYNITDLHAKILWFNTNKSWVESDAMSANYMRIYEHVNITEGQWLDIRETFSAPEGSETAWIWFGASRLGNYTSTVSYFSNMTFHEVSPVAKNAQDLFSIRQNVYYSQESPTRFIGQIDAVSPLILVFSESFNPSWVCYVNGQKVEPFCLYGAVNGYRIEVAGVSSLTLEYEPQSTYYAACVLSIITLTVCSVLLLYLSVKKRFNVSRSSLSKHLSCSF